MEKNINLKLDKYKTFYMYVNVMSLFLNISKREKLVLTELLLLYLQYSSYSDNHKHKLVFDKDNKKLICKKLEMSVHQLNNIFSNFRKKGVIKDNQINKNLLISFTNDLQIKINIKVNE